MYQIFSSLNCLELWSEIFSRHLNEIVQNVVENREQSGSKQQKISSMKFLPHAARV